MTAILETRNQEKKFGAVYAARDVNISIDVGEVMGVIGSNGAGKTTLMRSIMGILPVEKGSIQFNDAGLHRAKAHERAALGIGYLPEDRRLVPHCTVQENILVSLWATKNADRTRLKWVYELMPEIGRFSMHKALTLSGEQQKLVALVRALVAGSNLPLFDEPFEGVAPALAQRLMEVIGNLKSEHLTVLLSASDHTHSQSIVDKVYSIERRQVSLMNRAKAA